MRKKHRANIARLIVMIAALFILCAGMGLYIGNRYIKEQLLQSSENMAIDIAQLIKKNFEITDKETAYMKSLTFDQMEVDPINKRLMDVGSGIKLNMDITNIYVLAPLTDKEIKYTTDEETAQFFDFEVGTKLNGVWLMNGIMDENGAFVATKREDIYRYTYLSKTQEQAMKTQKAFTEYSEDAWGEFITGYVPLYMQEGNFVGLLGVDMNPNKYQESARKMFAALLAAFFVIALAAIGLFLCFYFKYVKAKEGQLYFDFYSRMSHDMRTPMNGILGLAQLSKKEEDPNILRHNFQMVEEAGNYMLGLINDTLDVQKMDAGKLKLDPKIRSYKEVMESILTMIRTEAEQKELHLEIVQKGIDSDCWFYIDEMRIRQIVMNLSSNAVKFTPKGGTITLIMECLRKEGRIHHDRFTIKDTGIGMSEKFIKEHLFRPFEQEQDSVTTQYGGSGLGLSIVKSLVSLMNGHIEVKSVPKKGTEFIVTLDLEEASKQDVEQIQNQLTSGKKEPFSVLCGTRVLLCEDHPLNIEIASRLLEKYGCEVTAVTNGKEGVERFVDSGVGSFDLILMDIRMPVMDGLSATRKIRASEKADAKVIPIIAMTANAYDEDKKECRKAGMNAHIVKPIDPKVMYQTIVQELQKAENYK